MERARGEVMRHWAKRLAAGLDLLLPPLCLSCRAPVADSGRLCAACFSLAQFIAAPMCRVCGVPLASQVETSGRLEIDLTCGACLAEPPAFARARSVLVFDEVARRLVHDFKYHDRLEGRGPFGAWLARAGADLLGDGAVIAPVPLHYTRLVQRRYNQSALLAMAAARASGRPLIVDLLARRRRTRQQVGLTEEERRANVRGAFAVRARHLPAIKDAHIVLVDDVLTTGATVSACTSALLKAGAAEVSVLTLARAPAPG